MNMTSEQRNFLTFIMEHKVILEGPLKDISFQKQAKDLHTKESIVVAGIHWSKFAEDSEGGRLQDELCPKIIDELGENALVTIQTSLFSHDGLKDYGKCDDMVSLLTYALYRNNRDGIKNCGEPFWTCTPDSTHSGSDSSYVQCVDSSGGVDYCSCDWDDRGVRPFFILKFDIFVACDNMDGSK